MLSGLARGTHATNAACKLQQLATTSVQAPNIPYVHGWDFSRLVVPSVLPERNACGFLQPCGKQVAFSILNRVRRFHASTISEAKERKTSKATSLQQALRRFYLRVHPDLFSNHPEEKEVNEKSFQVLMSFLDEFKDTQHQPSSMFGQQAFGAPKEHRVTFFFRATSPSSSTTASSSSATTATRAQSPSADAADHKLAAEDDGRSDAAVDDDTAKAADVEEVEFGRANVMLRSPLPGDSPENKDKYLQTQLAQLFEKCGVPHDFSVAGFAAARPKNWDMEVSLLHFAKQISDFARDKAQRRTAVENEMDMERTTFYIQHKLRILYEFPSDIIGDWQRRVKTEKDALKQLETTLKVVAASEFDIELLRGLVLVIGIRRGIDFLGRLNLHLSDDVYKWKELLMEVDLDRISRIKETGRKRDELEKMLATRLGLAYFYSDYSIANSLVYMSYINDIKVYFDETPALHDRVIEGMDTLKIRIVDPLSFDEKAESLKSGDDSFLGHIRSDKASATIIVPMGTPPQSVFDYIWQNDPDLSAKQIRSCCQKLLNQAGALLPYLEGTRMTFGFEYALKEDDGTVTIKHDWLL